MDSDRRPLIRLHINVIIGFWSLIAFIVVFVISFIHPEYFGSVLPLIRIGFTFLIIISAAIEGAEIKIFHGRYKFFKSLSDENYYTLGVHSTFFNLEAFRDKISELDRRLTLKDKQRYLVAFAPTATNISGGISRNRVLQSLNQTLASFINRIMVTKENVHFSRRNAAYAFDRNNFLFYLFTNDETEVHALITQLANECYRLVNEENIKIWVQPFSGICKVQKDEKSLTSSIEKAIIAKSQAEQNIESFAYYKEGFKDKDTTSAEEIIQGISNGEFIPYYQPKYSLKEKKIVSCEVLARWKTPEGILSPAKFIERAERAGLLHQIDLAIFEASMKDLGDALKRGRRVVPISVNFSLYEFFQKGFLDKVISVLEANQIPPTLLEVEITETTSQYNKFYSTQVISKLKNLGIRILMDDFGSGYAQIDNLRQIPFDAIKIDKSFTDKIVDDEKVRSIVRFLVQLIHDGDMEAIVEGVESKEQVDILRKMKVDTIQGFYYARPLPLAEYQKLLKENEFEKKEGKR
ncbi:MAG: EAL domain-containing protein [Bacilli bacterium]|nr:EAL domain-containing protein [Bacilli bacterium]